MKIDANPNATNSELDAKVIIHHNDQVDQFEYLKQQYHTACHMEEDYNEPS